MLIAAKHDVAVVLVDMVEDDDAKQNALLLYPVLDALRRRWGLTDRRGSYVR